MHDHDAEFCRELARGVCAVPVLYDSGDKSTLHLLKDAGLPKARPALSVDQVEEVLRAEDDLIRRWLKRGADQRLCGGWGIEREGQIYCVRDYGTGHAIHFADAAKATAEFLVRYVAFICDKCPRE